MLNPAGDKKLLPSPLILDILLIWLKASQSQALRQDWAAVDWEAFLVNAPPRFLEEIKTKRHELPKLIAEAWPPARGIAWLTVISTNRLDLLLSYSSVLEKTQASQETVY